MSPMTTVYQLWYIREASVAIQVGNIICCWQLFQKLFKVRSFDNKSAQIIANPEMARRHAREHPEQFSVGGSPKTTGWWARRRELFEHLGNWSRMSQAFISKESRSYASQPSDCRTDQNRMTGSTYVGVDIEKDPADVQNPVTLITLNRDGDDATYAIAYRDAESIA
jgi:hypothetical protein